MGGKEIINQHVLSEPDEEKKERNQINREMKSVEVEIALKLFFRLVLSELICFDNDNEVNFFLEFSFLKESRREGNRSVFLRKTFSKELETRQFLLLLEFNDRNFFDNVERRLIVMWKDCRLSHKHFFLQDFYRCFRLSNSIERKSILYFNWNLFGSTAWPLHDPRTPPTKPQKNIFFESLLKRI